MLDYQFQYIGFKYLELEFPDFLVMVYIRVPKKLYIRIYFCTEEL